MGAWQEIVDYTVPSNTTQVDFTGLNITKDDFIKVFINGNLGSYELYAENVLTTTNYYNQMIQADASSITASRFNTPRIYLAGTGGASAFGYIKLSENNKLNAFFNNTVFDSSSIRNRPTYMTSTSSFTSGINTLNFIAESADLINSRIQIYKLKAEKVADVLVNSNTTQVDITGLDIKKGDEYLLVSDINNNTSNGGGFNLYVNNNTTASNYYSQRVRGAGSSADANRYTDAIMTRMAGNNRGIAYSHIKLSNIGAYTSQNYSLIHYGTSILEIGNYFVSSTSENISSIKQLNIVREVATIIGNETRFQLYKLYEGGN